MENVFSYKIFYITGWTSPKIHYIFGGVKGKWTSEFLKKEPNKKNLYYFEKPSDQSIEFAFCNENKTSWDNNGSKNYKIKENGQECIVFKNTVINLNRTRSEQSFVFSIDLDGTLLGDGLALKEFEICWLKNCYFDDKKLLVYNTGRNFKSAVGILNEHLALLPDVFINSCGTEIFIYDSEKSDYEHEQKWKKIQSDKFPIKDIDILLSKYEWLLNRNMSDSRISFTAKYEDLKKNMDHLLEVRNMYSEKSLDVLISGNGEYRYIDILSTEGGKGKALKHLMALVKVNTSDSYAFGDSLNDVDMLELATFGIVVSNLQEDLAKHILEKKMKNIEFSQYNNANAILNKLKSIMGL